MKRVHERLLAVGRGTIGDQEPRPEPSARVAAAAKSLGGELPAGYRAFLEEVGSTRWPLTIGNVVDLTDDELPAFLVPFASDLHGNVYVFDTRERRDGECGIVFIDHEIGWPDPDEGDDPAEPHPFSDWLEGHVTQAERDAHAERRERVFARLAAHTDDPYVPSVEEAREAGKRLGVTLPEDYVQVTARLGSVTWPVQVVDALDLGSATAAMHTSGVKPPGALVAFAHEHGKGWVAFDARGRVHGFRCEREAPADFLDYLEDRIAQPPTPPAPPPAPRPGPAKASAAPAAATAPTRRRSPAPAAGRTTASPPPSPSAARGVLLGSSDHDDEEEGDPELAAAHRLLDRMRAEGLLETTRGFNASQIAHALAAQELSGTNVLEFLLERDDVSEVFASEEEIDALLGE